jgi:hypothetical protein
MDIMQCWVADIVLAAQGITRQMHILHSAARPRVAVARPDASSLRLNLLARTSLQDTPVIGGLLGG